MARGGGSPNGSHFSGKGWVRCAMISSNRGTRYERVPISSAYTTHGAREDEAGNKPFAVNGDPSAGHPLTARHGCICVGGKRHTDVWQREAQTSTLLFLSHLPILQRMGEEQRPINGEKRGISEKGGVNIERLNPPSIINGYINHHPLSSPFRAGIDHGPKAQEKRGKGPSYYISILLNLCILHTSSPSSPLSLAQPLSRPQPNPIRFYTSVARKVSAPATMALYGPTTRYIVRAPSVIPCSDR